MNNTVFILIYVIMLIILLCILVLMFRLSSIIKTVKELQDKIDNLEKDNIGLKERIKSLESISENVVIDSERLEPYTEKEAAELFRNKYQGRLFKNLVNLEAVKNNKE